MDRSETPAPKSPPTKKTFFVLGWPQFIVGTVVVGLTTLAALLFLWPALELEYLERFVIPRYETEFGFTGGLITVEEPDAPRHEVFGLLQVDPAGPLGLVGFRDGDVPVHIGHGAGVQWFAHALDRARRGKAAKVKVVQAEAWGTPERIRELEIAPLSTEAGAPVE